MITDKDELTRRTMAELIKLIEKRSYDPGERLPSERELSERFQVGRGVVREVLSVLEGLRFLERRRNSGIYLNVAPERISLEALSLFSALGVSLSVEKLSEALEVRRIIELQGVLLASQRRTDEDLHTLASIIQRFEEAIAHGTERIEMLDYEFHMAIFRATQNMVLTQLVHPFYLMSESRRKLFFSDKTRCLASNEHHKEILNAIIKQDSVLAQEIMSQHIGRVELLCSMPGQPSSQ
jgi:GntR family transcriptional repressor for pyruvate dehydrogenase complex